MVADRWQTFLDSYPTRVYRHGQIILFQGESPRSILVVKSGTVKTYNIDDDGKEQFIDIQFAGSTFPKLWAWNKETVAQFYHEAMSDCVLYAVPKEVYVDYIKKDNDRLLKELSDALIDYKNSSTRLNALLYTRASDKIAHILKYLASNYAPEADKNIVKINLKLTHQHLASLTGLTRETVSVELNKFKSLGVIDYKPSEYKINLAKLDQLLKRDF